MMAMAGCVWAKPPTATGACWGFSEDCLLAKDCPAKAVFAWSSVFALLALTWCFLATMAAGQSETSQPSTSQKSSTAQTAGKKTAGINSIGGKSSGASAKSSASLAPPHSTPHASPTRSSSTAQRKSNSVVSSRSAKGRRSTKKRMARGQQKIDPARAEEIQEALIREHYLTGEPSGKWDQASEDALRRYQADHGWQSKTVPDSRALISLGLGPNHDHLLNPESAMTTGPENSHPAPLGSSSRASHNSESAPASTSPAPAPDPAQPNSGAHNASSPQR
jgi:hypothetical protein